MIDGDVDLLVQVCLLITTDAMVGHRLPRRFGATVQISDRLERGSRQVVRVHIAVAVDVRTGVDLGDDQRQAGQQVIEKRPGNSKVPTVVSLRRLVRFGRPYAHSRTRRQHL